MFEPAVLKWAREKRGMPAPLVAAKLAESWKHITLDTLQNWESGSEEPTPSQVKKLAEIYRRPLAVFFLAHHPEENPLPPDRRTMWRGANKALSSDALLVIRRARRIQELADELDEALGAPRRFKYSKHTITENPAALAATVREDMGVSLDDQMNFRRYSDFFEYLRMKIEGTGVITLKSGGPNSFSKEDARAFSFTDRQPYVILVNNKDTEGAKTFSLLHEFCHVLVREAGICDNFSTFNGSRGRVDGLEVFCNEFAAQFLVPDKALLEHRVMRGQETVSPTHLESVVKPLASAFKVSRFVILRRLLSLGLITTGVYKGKAEEWENENPPVKSGGRSVPAQAAIAGNGISFSSLVIEAYRHEKVSYATASDYLGVKTKHLPEIEKRLHAHGR